MVLIAKTALQQGHVARYTTVTRRDQHESFESHPIEQRIWVDAHDRRCQAGPGGPDESRAGPLTQLLHAVHELSHRGHLAMLR